MDRIRVYPEREATGELKNIYSEIRKECRFHWVPTVFQAFALYPEFMRLFWKHFRPVVRDPAIECGAAQILRRAGERVGTELHPEAGMDYLLGRTPQRFLGVYHQGLMPFYLGAPRIFVVMSRVHTWFFGSVPGEDYEKIKLKRLPYPNQMVSKVTLVLDEHKEREAAELFERIRTDLKSPVTNNAYRSLARTPEFLRPAWDSLHGHLGTPAYRSIEAELREVAGAWSRELPRMNVSHEQIENLPDMDEHSFRLLAVIVDIFYRLFPALVINLTYWSHQLHAARSRTHSAAS